MVSRAISGMFSRSLISSSVPPCLPRCRGGAVSVCPGDAWPTRSIPAGGVAVSGPDSLGVAYRVGGGTFLRGEGLPDVAVLERDHDAAVLLPELGVVDGVG